MGVTRKTQCGNQSHVRRDEQGAEPHRHHERLRQDLRRPQPRQRAGRDQVDGQGYRVKRKRKKNQKRLKKKCPVLCPTMQIVWDRAGTGQIKKL